MNEAVPEPGSFRDRTARVFYHDGRVFRGLSETALHNWNALSSSAFYRRLTKQGAIVATERVDPTGLLPGDIGREWAAVLSHDSIPFVSYPYEWPFSMLKDAAVLQLDLLLAALDERMTLKDASPFNVQWNGVAPVFVDIPSFEPWTDGDVWVGYQQFCQLFLFPLLLLAYRDVPYHPFLRGRLDGIDAETCRNLMGVRDYFRAGVLTHVYLQTRAQAALKQTRRDIRADLRATGFGREMIQANVRRLRRMVARLAWNRKRSTWSDYASCGHYESVDMSRKRDFVREVVLSREWELVWDLGANTGAFARIAAERARYVVAVDGDHFTVDRMYQQLKAEGNRRILPLVMNLADPSPDLGWRTRERKQLAARGRPDLILCLALVHHLVIGGNIPLNEIVGWIAELGGDLIIEFVTREDPMVATLLRNKVDQYTDYDEELFERELRARFVIERREPLGSGTRIMYYARRPERSGTAR